jgi:Tfp pilus assembly PilM family ATPase
MAECLRFVSKRLSASTCPSQLQLSTNLNKSARQDVLRRQKRRTVSSLYREHGVKPSIREVAAAWRTVTSITITDQEVREALNGPISVVVSGVRQAIERLPSDLAEQVAERGIVLVGGGALLRGLAVRLTHDTGVPASIADDPVSTVALGTGRMLDDLDLVHRVERCQGSPGSAGDPTCPIPPEPVVEIRSSPI